MESLCGPFRFAAMGVDATLETIWTGHSWANELGRFPSRQLDRSAIKYGTLAACERLILQALAPNKHSVRS